MSLTSLHEDEKANAYAQQWLTGEQDQEDEVDQQVQSGGSISALDFSSLQTPIDGEEEEEDDPDDMVSTDLHTEHDDPDDGDDEVDPDDSGTTTDDTALFDSSGEDTPVDDEEEDGPSSTGEQPPVNMETALGETDETVPDDTGSQTVSSGSPNLSEDTASPTSMSMSGPTPQVEVISSDGGDEGVVEPELGPSVGQPPTGDTVSTDAPLIGPPTTADDDLVHHIYTTTMGTAPEDMSAYAETRMGELAGAATADEAAITAHGAGIAASIEGLVASKVAEVNSAFNDAISGVQSHFATLRGEIDAAVAEACGAVDSALGTAVANVESAVTTRTGEVEGAYDAALGSLDGVASDATANATTEWNKRVQQVRDGGRERAQAAMNAAKTLASGWRGGDGIEKERNDARRKAVMETGRKYAKEVLEKAKAAADDFAKGGDGIAQAMTDVVQQFVDPTTQAKADAVQALLDAGTTARGDLEEQAEASKIALRDSGEAAKNTLSEQERAAVEGLTATRDQAVSGLEAAGVAAAAEVTGVTEKLASTYGAFLDLIRSQLTAGEPPQMADTDAAVAEAMGILAETKAAQLAALDDVLSRFTATANTSAAQAVASANTTRNEILADASALAGEMKAGIAEAGANHGAGLARFADETNKRIGEMADGSCKAAEETVLKAEKAAKDVETTLMTDLDESRDNVLGELDQAVTSVTKEGSKAAAKAASTIKEKSFWEKAWDVVTTVVSTVLAVVATIVVFLVVAAFIIATFGTGLAVLIAAGAIAGALAAVVGGLVGDATKALMLWDSGQFKSWQEYAQMGIVGFVTGAFAIPGALASGFAAIAIGLGAAWTGSLADQITDIELLDQEWNTGEFVSNGLLGSVMLFAGKLVPKSWGDRFLNKMFPNSGNTWNGFQSFCKDTPWLKNLTTQQRADIWNNVVKSKVQGVPEETVGKLFEELLKGELGNTLNLNDDADAQQVELNKMATPTLD